MSQDDETYSIPLHTVEVLATYVRVRRLLTHRLGREPTHEELAEALGITSEEVQEIVDVSARPFLPEGETLAHIRLGITMT